MYPFPDDYKPGFMSVIPICVDIILFLLFWEHSYYVLHDIWTLLLLFYCPQIQNNLKLKGALYIVYICLCGVLSLFRILLVEFFNFCFALCISYSLSPHALVETTDMKRFNPDAAAIIEHLANPNEEFLPTHIRQDLYIKPITSISFTGNLLHYAILFNKPKAVKQLIRKYKTLERVRTHGHPLDMPSSHISEKILFAVSLVTMVLVYFWGFTGIISFFVLSSILKMMKVDIMKIIGILLRKFPSLHYMDPEQMARRLGHEECTREFYFAGVTYQVRARNFWDDAQRKASWKENETETDFQTFLNMVMQMSTANIPENESAGRNCFVHCRRFCRSR